MGYALITGALSGGFPPKPDRGLVLDIQDHSLTFGPFSSAVAQGIFAKRRLTPIVEWSAVEKALKESSVRRCAWPINPQILTVTGIVGIIV